MRSVTLLNRAIALAVVAAAARAQAYDGSDGDARVSRLVMRATAEANGATIRLSDVLSFAGAGDGVEQALAEEPLLSNVEGPLVEVTHDQVVKRLEALEVNLARVLVSGAVRCQVRVHSTEEPKPAGQSPRAGDPHPRTRVGMDADDGVQNLGEAIEQLVRTSLDRLDGEVQVEFERAGTEFLRLTSPPFEFQIKPRGGQQLGLREFSVAINRDGRRQRSAVIVAHVRLMRTVIVAGKPLNAGSCVKREALDFAQHLFSADADLGYSNPEELIGQVVQSFVPAGQVLRKGDLKPTDLVIRSRPVTVVGGGDVYVRLTGTALDSGGFGETVRVRLGDVRNSKRVIRGVVSGLAAVRLTEE